MAAAVFAVAAGVVSAAVLVAVDSVFLQQRPEKLMRVILLSFRVMEILIPAFAEGVDIFRENSFDETDFHVSDCCWIAPMTLLVLVLVSLLP